MAFWNLGWMYENGLGVAQVGPIAQLSTLRVLQALTRNVNRTGILPSATTIFVLRRIQKLNGLSCSRLSSSTFEAGGLN